MKKSFLFVLLLLLTIGSLETPVAASELGSSATSNASITFYGELPPNQSEGSIPDGSHPINDPPLDRNSESRQHSSYPRTGEQMTLDYAIWGCLLVLVSLIILKKKK